MTPTEIRESVKKLNCKTVVGEEEAWDSLRELGISICPYLREAYTTFGKWQGRTSLLYHSIKYARESEDAFQLGLEALQDRATVVRYRACALLAYSLRKEAIRPLKKLLKHTDPKTVGDAKAAIRAIKKKNHNLFMDRNGSGFTTWVVTNSDREKAYGSYEA